MTVNWIAAFNYLFSALNSENKALYVGGGTFCRAFVQMLADRRGIERSPIAQKVCSNSPARTAAPGAAYHAMETFHRMETFLAEKRNHHLGSGGRS